MRCLLSPPSAMINFIRSSAYLRTFTHENLLGNINFCTRAFSRAFDKDQANIVSLNIKQNINKINKQETFVTRSVFGELDSDYLRFPNFLTKEDGNLLTNQYEFIRKNFKILSQNNQKLTNFGFNNLNSLTTFELCFLFEAIGASLNFNQSKINTIPSQSLIPLGDQLLIPESFLRRYEEQKHFFKTIFPLVIQNSLILNSINFSNNHQLKELILPVINGENYKVAFAFCEPDDNFVSVPYPYWNSTAIYDPKSKSWTLNGLKSRILKNDYDYYLINCKTVNNDGKKVSDYGIASFIVNKNKLIVEEDGSDNYGNNYLKISFKDLNLSKQECELFGNNPNMALNIKATGQLTTSSIILGMLKESLKNITYLHTFNESFIQNGLVQEKITTITQMIFGLESMLYLTAHHFDVYNSDRIELFLEAIMVKIYATEFAYEILKRIRFLFDCHQVPFVIFNDVTEVLNMLDSFLDSSTSNRMLLANYGLRNIGSWRFDHIAKIRLRHIYMSYFMKFNLFPFYQKNVLQRTKTSMDGFKDLKNLPTSLQEPGKLLKQVLNDLTLSGTHLLETYGKDCVSHQIEMNRFSSIIMSAFQMVSVIARVNTKLQDKNDQNSIQQELSFCRHICHQEARKVKTNKNLIEGILDTSEENRSKQIHKRNLRFEGYFVKSTFDRII